MINKFTATILLLSVVSLCQAASKLNRWALVKQPAAVAEGAQSIGGYAAGCLGGAVKLPINGEGYQAMRLSRQRFYGHPDLIRFIEKMGRSAVDNGWGALLIGDLGQPRGGPTLTGHRSHQTGLDVDIWYLQSQQAGQRPLTTEERETWSAPSMLLAKSDKIDVAQWSDAHEQMLAMAARMPEVARIFVNPSIKRKLCETKGERDWLNKIRPWWRHDDHFHVRLNCPENNPYCSSQEPVPAGDGCDASLDWWFSAEARKPVAKPGPVREPVLPEQCERILQQ